jgi:serine phosphatase RsbU (regulator of sigma subunit)/pSer/pThr/pTyr-binding forkhead associated (FHA) protein
VGVRREGSRLTRLQANEKVVVIHSVDGLPPRGPASGPQAQRPPLCQRPRIFAMPTLEVNTESGEKQFFELSGDETVVGRDQFCDIVLRRHTVSRQHARIVRAPDGYYVEDLSSLNGTYLNGRRLEGRTLIKDQDRIHVYEVVTVFHEAAPDEVRAALVGEGDGAREPLERSPLPEEPGDQGQAASRTMMAPADKSAAVADPSSQACFRAALKISVDLEGEQEIDEILPKILDTLFEIFPQAVRGYILLAEGADGHLVPRAIKHRESESGHSVTFGPISRKTALHVMSTAEAILMDEGPPEHAADANSSIFEVRSLSMICAPLMGPSRTPLGILYLDTTDPSRRFRQEDLDVLVTVATIAGEQVETAGARHAPDSAAAPQRRLGTAKQVQLQFLPQNRPQITGYRFYDYYQPADEVGGDYFGYILLGDGRLALTIGDVAGKGVSAALLMAHFCAEVRYCLSTSATPADAVNQLNQDLSAETLNYHFVTFALCVLDPAKHRLTIVNAGHLPPLRRRGAVITDLGGIEGGLPLGCDHGHRYEQVELTLDPGDTVVMYTDGISEAMNAKGEVFGSRRIREAIIRSPAGVERVGQTLLDDVRRFVRGRLPSDDICVVCFARDS